MIQFGEATQSRGITFRPLAVGSSHFVEIWIEGQPKTYALQLTIDRVNAAMEPIADTDEAKADNELIRACVADLLESARWL